ncbi:MAG TPA: hypothetical protein VMF62_20905 [Acetobacteraceae bacterium]|nr:hypothetical protein [Acetobacteraceae bacterium]
MTRGGCFPERCFRRHPRRALRAQSSAAGPNRPFARFHRFLHGGKLFLVAAQGRVQRFERAGAALERLERFVARQLDVRLLCLKIADSVHGFLEGSLRALAPRPFRLRRFLGDGQPIDDGLIGALRLRPPSPDDGHGDFPILDEAPRRAARGRYFGRAGAQAEAPYRLRRRPIANGLVIRQAQGPPHPGFRSVRLAFAGLPRLFPLGVYVAGRVRRRQFFVAQGAIQESTMVAGSVPDGRSAAGQRLH